VNRTGLVLDEQTDQSSTNDELTGHWCHVVT